MFTLGPPFCIWDFPLWLSSISNFSYFLCLEVAQQFLLVCGASGGVEYKSIALFRHESLQCRMSLFRRRTGNDSSGQLLSPLFCSEDNSRSQRRPFLIHVPIIPDPGYCIPDPRYSIPDPRFTIPDHGYTIPDPGYNLPDHRNIIPDFHVYHSLSQVHPS